MICPSCKYENRKDEWGNIEVEGNRGDFYKHPIKLSREEQYYGSSMIEAYVFGCPSCKISFIEEIENY